MDPHIADLLGIDLDDQETRRSAAAVERDMRLIESLIKVRLEKGLTQKQVAARMGRSQSVVSDFERVGGDPHLSTIRRYALALGVEVRHGVQVCVEIAPGWSPTAHISGKGQVGEEPGVWSADEVQVSYTPAAVEAITG